MNAKTLLVIVGLVIGAVAGWFTAPQASTVDVGPLHMKVEGGDNGNGGNATVTTGNGGINVNVSSNSPFDDRGSRTAIFAVIGGIVGLVAGFVLDRRRA
jgi:uncharacterized protein YcfJ